MDNLYRCKSCGIPEGGSHDIGCPEQRGPDRKVIFYCANCDAPNPSMHNSRETGSRGSTILTKRFPGFLCISCWKLANPRLMGKPVIGISGERPKPFVIQAHWLIYSVGLIILVAFLFSR